MVVGFTSVSQWSLRWKIVGLRVRLSLVEFAFPKRYSLIMDMIIDGERKALVTLVTTALRNFKLSLWDMARRSANTSDTPASIRLVTTR